MDYSTPGVYIREVDSGAKPIASVATSVPGFLGMFHHSPSPDATQINVKDGANLITGKIPLKLVDKQGNITGNAATATEEITSAMRLNKGKVKDLGKFLSLHGVKVGGKGGASFAKKDNNVEVSFKGKTVLAESSVLAADGKIVSEDEAIVNDLLNSISSTFELVAKPKNASDILEAYGYSFDSAEETAMDSQYTIPPYAVTNKADFFRWLRGFYAQYLYDNHSTEELLGKDVEDPDEAVDAIFEAINEDDNLKKKFYSFLSQESVFNFVTAVSGFYDNGGGKAYVYVNSGKKNKDGSIKVKKVTFGSSMPDAMGDSDKHKARRKSFGLRHNCADKKDKTKPGYWSCRLTKFFGRNISGWW